MNDDLREKLAMEFASLRAVDYDQVLPSDYETANAALDVIRKEQALQFLADEGQKCDAMQEAGAGVEQASIALDIGEAMQELLASPMGVVPQCADKYYDTNTGVFCARRIISALEPSAPTVQEAARVLLDAAEAGWPSDWQAAWSAMKEDAKEGDMPAAFYEALRALADGEAE